MLNVIGLDADFCVAVNAVVDTAGAAAITADKDQGFEHFWMIQPEQKRHPRADAYAAENRLFHRFVAANSQHVVGHLFETEGRRWFVRAAIPADVHGDNFEVGREVSDLIHPQVVVEGIGVDHHERQAFAGNFVVDSDAIGGAVGHDQFGKGSKRSTASLRSNRLDRLGQRLAFYDFFRQLESFHPRRSPYSGAGRARRRDARSLQWSWTV